MRIVICEDDAVQAKMTAEYIRLLSQEFVIDDVIVYSAGQTLCEALELGVCFDVYLLDIDLPGVNGLTLGTRIRKKQPYACIAFFTSYPQYVTHAFTLQSAQYFLKPIDKPIFMSAMRQMLREYANAWITLMIENERTIAVRQEEIVYVEFYHGIMTVCTRTGSYQVRGNTKVWKRTWYQRGFLQSHQGYFVNPRHICVIGTDTVLCTDDISCPLSARCRKDFMDQFLEYMQ